MMKAIEVSNFTKKFGNITAVNDVSFSVNEGQIVGLLGPNGAGKTTTIRMITGVFPLNKDASLRIFGENIDTTHKSYNQNFGIVPEISNAYRDYSVWQNIRFNGRIYGMKPDVIKEQGKALLNTFQLSQKRDQRTKTLSKGLKQRLNFCMALIHDPKILIFDEPTSGLDPISVGILRDQIESFKQEGRTVLITTHDLSEAQRLCDKILIMNRGRIIADEEPEKLRQKIRPQLHIRIQFDSPLTQRQQEQVKSMFHPDILDSVLVAFSSGSPLDDLSAMHTYMKNEDLHLKKLKVDETSLEEIFIQLITEDEFQ